MKNKELIDFLKQFNPDAWVTTPVSKDIEISYIDEDIDGNVYTKSNTPIVFIELSNYGGDMNF